LDDFDRAAAEATHNSRVAHACIVALIRCHPRGIARALREDISAEHFDHDDHRAIFIALEHYRDRQKLDALHGARFNLRRVNRWDDATPAGSTGALWSCATLARAATTSDVDDAFDALGPLFLELRAAWKAAA
ncbi:MAG: hypothetical protein WBD40_23585, partial [Tepidisphaeraceae bacterium]